MISIEQWLVDMEKGLIISIQWAFTLAQCSFRLVYILLPSSSFFFQRSKVTLIDLQAAGLVQVGAMGQDLCSSCTNFYFHFHFPFQISFSS